MWGSENENSSGVVVRGGESGGESGVVGVAICDNM